MTGAINNAICSDEFNATPRTKSILSFLATKIVARICFKTLACLKYSHIGDIVHIPHSDFLLLVKELVPQMLVKDYSLELLHLRFGAKIGYKEREE